MGGGPPNPTTSDVLGNTAGGAEALYNTTGKSNTAFGEQALFSNTAGTGNTAVGFDALTFNLAGGNYNTATGVEALFSNTTGNNNTASGAEALKNNSTGENNTAFGTDALFENTTGGGNTAVGISAGLTNIAGSGNTFIGTGANANADYTNGTALGAGALLFQSNSIVLGNTSISAIFADVSITAVSDRRRKKDIRALDADLGLDFIEKLKPVSYRFSNGDETERYGFIAQDLEQALPASLHDTVERSEPEHGLALIERQNDKDRTYRVSYDELLAPIVKSIQEQQQEIATLRQQNADLRRALEAMEHRVSALVQNAALHHSMRGQREQVAAAR